MRRAGLCLMLSACFASAAGAEERVTIRQLEQSHGSYHLHSVTIAGIVQAVQLSPPTPSPSEHCRELYGIAEFTLVDDTGSLPVEILGTCNPDERTLLQDGDVIEVTAQVQFFNLNGGGGPALRAIAQNIPVLKVGD
ncbi:MAG TPA: OB-fold nucleic acid binding domain-containing protein [Nitrospira sp.]|nr:OB-fold nucleic acid binding domain-containing protein [Nitrospira sp.]